MASVSNLKNVLELIIQELLDALKNRKRENVSRRNLQLF
jgi:hypothetical protein